VQRTSSHVADAPGRRSRARSAERPVILFVEDQPMLRFTVSSELEDAGYEVVHAGSGEEAIAILERGAPVDALLTDIRLPGRIDGWDIAERARELRPDLPVVYGSAYSYVTPRRVPSAVTLDKPYTPRAVLGALDGLLG